MEDVLFEMNKTQRTYYLSASTNQINSTFNLVIYLNPHFINVATNGMEHVTHIHVYAYL